MIGRGWKIMRWWATVGLAMFLWGCGDDPPSDDRVCHGADESGECPDIVCPGDHMVVYIIENPDGTCTCGDESVCDEF